MRTILSCLILICGPFFAQADCDVNHNLEIRKIAKTPYFEMGSPDAPVVMNEFFSLTCPSCASFQTQIFPRLQREYIETGKLRVRFYEFISDQVALIGGKTSRCIAPDLYVKYTEFLMEDQEQWAYSEQPVEELKKRAMIFGLSAAGFDACLDDKAINAQLLDAQKRLTKEADITHTPTFIFTKKGQSFIDGQKIQGFQDFKTYEKIINSYL